MKTDRTKDSKILPGLRSHLYFIIKIHQNYIIFTR